MVFLTPGTMLNNPETKFKRDIEYWKARLDFDRAYHEYKAKLEEEERELRKEQRELLDREARVYTVRRYKQIRFTALYSNEECFRGIKVDL